MSDYFCISVTFLEPRFHGRGDGGEPEWPPSPLRLYQSLVAANTDRIGELAHALTWFEEQKPPTIFAPRFEHGAPYRLSVPNNAMDIVGKAWSRGKYFEQGNDNDPAKHRTMKTVCPIHLIDGDVVHYCWELSDPSFLDGETHDRLVGAAERIHTLGWGIDTVIGTARILTSAQLKRLAAERWKLSDALTNNMLRTPIAGTLDALRSRHALFLKRVDIKKKHFTPVDPLSHFEMTYYRRCGDPRGRPHVIFHLRDESNSFISYPQARLIHIAGMVRHQALEAMRDSPPPWIENVAEWLDSYVAGHVKNRDAHRQLSYIPLPSIGHPHADYEVRRALISAPVGDEHILHHLAIRLNGSQLFPLRGDEFGQGSPPTLVRIGRDRVTSRYTGRANIWTSITPVILPGHNDRKKAKTVKLIEKALVQSGIEQPCSYEWREVSWFPKAVSAHKYDREKRRIGFVRPDHLLNYSAVHLKIRFTDGLYVPGPMVIGAGRHVGLGTMAHAPDNG